MADVLIIGAGPAGAIAAALLARRGYEVLVLERQKFPRFSIGESLLANSMQFIEEAGMLEAVLAGGFQFKNGAAFVRDGAYSDYNFAQKSAAGYATPSRCRAPTSTRCWRTKRRGRAPRSATRWRSPRWIFPAHRRRSTARMRRW